MATNVVGNTVSEDAVKITFTHPAMMIKPGPLSIYVNPDAVTWAYGLNTASYPTYGGEVVQILSVYFDDMTITGTTRSVAELETIYSWFIIYMQYATQGTTAGPRYNQQPVSFSYLERGWQFFLWPKSLPGFSYSLDAVTSTWTLTAAVKEPEVSFSGTLEPTLSQSIMDVSAFNAMYKGQFTTFGVATGNFGTTADLENNPFADSDAPAALKAGTNVASYVNTEIKGLANQFTGFVGDWQNSDLSALPQFQNISIPAQVGLTGKKNTGTTTKKGSVKKK